MQHEIEVWDRDTIYTRHLRVIPGDLNSARWQFHTLPKPLHSQAALLNSYPNTCMPSREAFCTIFIKVFGVTRPVREPTTYCMSGEHTDH